MLETANKLNEDVKNKTGKALSGSIARDLVGKGSSRDILAKVEAGAAKKSIRTMLWIASMKVGERPK